MTEQTEMPLESYAHPMARITDPTTSFAAARTVKNRTITDTMIFILLQLELGRKTDFQLAEVAIQKEILVSESGLRTRRKELERAKLVEWDGNIGKSPAGRSARFWRITDKGKHMLSHIKSHPEKLKIELEGVT
jgi:hypothetical protein